MSPKHHAKRDGLSLLQRTVELLRTRRHTYAEIYKATDLQVNWLSALATNRIRDPSVKRVQKLHDFLVKSGA